MVEISVSRVKTFGVGLDFKRDFYLEKKSILRVTVSLSQKIGSRSCCTVLLCGF